MSYSEQSTKKSSNRYAYNYLATPLPSLCVVAANALRGVGSEHDVIGGARQGQRQSGRGSPGAAKSLHFQV